MSDALPCETPAAPHAASLNPVTGLSTDYLNHFNEAIMLLEMLPSLPECLEDFAAWRPLDYRQHFARSGLARSEAAVAAYDRADPQVRRSFDALCAEMTAAIVAAQAALAGAADADAVAAPATDRLKRLAVRASAVIRGCDPTAIAEPQAAIDAILEP